MPAALGISFFFYLLHTQQICLPPTHSQLYTYACPAAMRMCTLTNTDKPRQEIEALTCATHLQVVFMCSWIDCKQVRNKEKQRMNPLHTSNEVQMCAVASTRAKRLECCHPSRRLWIPKVSRIWVKIQRIPDLGLGPASRCTQAIQQLCCFHLLRCTILRRHSRSNGAN